MRSEKKLHLEQQIPSLDRRLTCLGAQYSGACVVFDSTFGKQLDLSLSFVGEDSNYLWVRAVFSKPPVNLSNASFTVAGPISVHSLSGQDRSFVLVLQKTGFGQASISIASNTIVDDLGEFFPAAGPIIRQINSRPIPVITGPTQVSIGTTELTITFSDNVTGLSIADFVVVGGSVNSLTGSDNNYTFNLEVTSNQAEVQVVLPAGVCQGDNLSTNVDSNVYSPVVSKGPLIATVRPTKSIFSTFLTTFLIEWNAAVGDSFSQQDLTVNTGIISGFVKVNNSKFLVNVTVTQDTAVTLTVEADTVTLFGYDPNLEASGYCQVQTTSLTFTLVPPTGWLNGEATIEVLANGPNSGLSASDFIVQNGVVLDWTIVDNGGSLVVAPTSFNQEVVINVSIPAGAAVNPAGLENEPAGPVYVYHDSLAPVITFISFIKVQDEYELVLRTSEIVVRVINYAHPECSSTVFTGEGLNWTIRVSPIADKGNLQFNLPSGLFVDKAYNPSSAISSPVYTFDTVGPIGTWQLVADGHLIDRVTNKKNRVFTLTFDSQLSAELTLDKIGTSAGLVVSGLEVIQARQVYRVSTVNSGSTGIAELQLPAGAVSDTQNNLNSLASVINWDYDFVKPTVVDSSVTVNIRDVAFIIELREPVIRNPNNLQLLTQNLTINSVTVTSQIVAVSASVSSNISSNNLQVGIALPSNFVLDSADNGNDETSYFTTVVDTAGPTVLITSPQYPQTNSQIVVFIIEFSSLLSGNLLRSQLQLINAVLDPLIDSDTSFVTDTPARIYIATVKAVQDGEVSLTVPANILLDLDGNPNTQGNLSVLVGNRFDLSLSFAAGSKTDNRILTVSSAIPLQQDSLTATDITPSGGALSVVDGNAFNNFIVQLSPALTTAVATIRDSQVLSTTGQTNNQVVQQLSYTAMTATAIMTSATEEVVRNVDIAIDIEWNIRVQRFTVADLKIGIRNSDLEVISGTGFVGIITGLIVIESGYKFRATCRVSEFPTNLQERMHVWHEATVDGTADMANRPVVDRAYIDFSFIDPLVSVFSSSDFPSTTKRLITFVVTFNGDLATNLVQQNFTLTNAAIGGQYPGSSFTVSSNGRQYTLVVYALTVDAVTVALANNVAQGAQGEFVQGGQLTVAWLGLQNFLLEWVISTGDYPDQFYFYPTVDQSVEFDYSQVTVETLTYSSAYVIEKASNEGNGLFVLYRRPNTSQVLFEAAAGVYRSEDGRENNRAVGNRSVLAFLERLTITSEFNTVVYGRDIEFTITSNTKMVGTFDVNDLDFGLRDTNQQPVSGFGQDGSLQELVETVPGYVWRGKYRLNQQITTTQYKFYIWFTNIGNDFVNLFNMPARSNSWLWFDVPGTFSVRVLSGFAFGQRPDYPEIYPFVIEFNQDLLQDITADDLEIVNGQLDAASPGGGFLVETARRQYRVYVKPTITGEVILRVPAGVATSVTGLTNTGAELSEYWTEYFDISGTILPTSKVDQFRVVLTVPEGTPYPTGLVNNIIQTNVWVVTKNHVPDSFEWIIRVHTNTGPAFQTSESRQIQISVSRNAFTNDTNGRNKPYVFTPVPFTITPTVDLTVENTPISTGDTFLVRVKSNCYFNFDADSNPFQNVSGVAILCYCGFVDSSDYSLISRGSSLPGLTLTGTGGVLAATTVDVNYEYTWAFTVTSINPPKRNNTTGEVTYGDRSVINQEWQEGITSTGQPILRFTSEAFLSVVPSNYIDSGARPSKTCLLLSNGSVFPEANANLYQRLPIDVTKHLVEFDWIGDVFVTFPHAFHDVLLDVFEKTKLRTVIIKVSSPVLLSATDTVMNIDWGDGTTEEVLRQQAFNQIQSTAESLEFHLSHIYPDASSYTVGVEAASIYFNIDAVCEAKLRLNGTMRPVTPDESSLNRIIAFKNNRNRDQLGGIKEVRVSKNTAGLLAAVRTGTANVVKSLKAYSGYFVFPADSQIYNHTDSLNPFATRQNINGVIFPAADYFEIYTTRRLDEALGLNNPNHVYLHDCQLFGANFFDTLKFTTTLSYGWSGGRIRVYFRKCNALELTSGSHWHLVPQPTQWLESVKQLTVRDAGSLFMDELAIDARFLQTEKYVVLNSADVQLRINWYRNLYHANNETWPQQNLGVKIVQIVEHQMSYLEELNFFTRLEGILNTLINTAGPGSQAYGWRLLPDRICEIYVKRSGGINPQTSDDIMHNNAIQQSIVNIALYSQQANAPDVFRIIRE